MFLLERLTELKKKLGFNAEPDSLRQLEIWEKEIKEAMLMEDLAKHEAVKKLLEEAKGWILKFNTELSTNQKLTQEERDIIFGKKEMFSWLIGLFDKNYLKNIEDEIDNNLNNLNL